MSDTATVVTIMLMGCASATLLVYGLMLLLRARKVAVQERIEAYTSTQLTSGLMGQVDEDEALLTPVGRLLRRVFGKNYFDKIEEELVRADLPLRPSEYVLSRLVLAGVFFLLMLLRVHSLLPSIALGFAGFMLPYLHMKLRQTRRTTKFNEQLANVLMLMTNSLRAGYSFIKALEVAASEMQPPISKEFGKVFREVNLGFTMEEALQRAARRVGSEDFNVVVSAYLVQKEVGGSLAEVMEKVAMTIRERFKLQGEIRVMTSQGKLSGLVVGLLPFAVAVALLFVAPEYLRHLVDPAVSVPLPVPFLPTPVDVPMGYFFIVFAVFLQVVGLLVIWKIVNFKV
jgi:tight adherence protein B